MSIFEYIKAILKICPNTNDSYFGKVAHNIFA